MSLPEAKSSFDRGYISLRSGITIYPEQDRKIDASLKEMLDKIPARFTLLADISGQIVSVQGERGQADPVVLGSLIAGDLAASQEIARVTGEYQTTQMVLREGQKSHSFITEAGPYLALLVQVSSDVPLGWARIVIKKTASDLAEIVATMPEPAEQPKLEFGKEGDVAELFGDALDDMWTTDEEFPAG